MATSTAAAACQAPPGHVFRCVGVSALFWQPHGPRCTPRRGPKAPPDARRALFELGSSPPGAAAAVAAPPGPLRRRPAPPRDAPQRPRASARPGPAANGRGKPRRGCPGRRHSPWPGRRRAVPLATGAPRSKCSRPHLRLTCHSTLDLVSRLIMSGSTLFWRIWPSRFILRSSRNGIKSTGRWLHE